MLRKLEVLDDFILAPCIRCIAPPSEDSTGPECTFNPIKTPDIVLEYDDLCVLSLTGCLEYEYTLMDETCIEVDPTQLTCNPTSQRLQVGGQNVAAFYCMA